MDSIMSRVSYLNGLIEGLGISSESKEGKVIAEIASILKDMANEIELLGYAQDDIEDYVEALDEDLSCLEDEFFDDEDCDCDCDCNCDDYDDFDDDYMEIDCPNCKETVYIDKCMCDDNEKVTCPNCHETINLD